MDNPPCRVLEGHDLRVDCVAHRHNLSVTIYVYLCARDIHGARSGARWGSMTEDGLETGLTAEGDTPGLITSIRVDVVEVEMVVMSEICISRGQEIQVNGLVVDSSVVKVEIIDSGVGQERHVCCGYI
jgi:hypothetical protein